MMERNFPAHIQLSSFLFVSPHLTKLFLNIIDYKYEFIRAFHYILKFKSITNRNNSNCTLNGKSCTLNLTDEEEGKFYQATMICLILKLLVLYFAFIASK